MEVQVDFFGIDVALKLVLIWYLFSHDGFCAGSILFILKVRPYLYTHFLDNIHFLQKHVHLFMCDGSKHLYKFVTLSPKDYYLIPSNNAMKLVFCVPYLLY